MNTVGFSSSEQGFTGIGEGGVIDPQSLGIGISFNELPDNEPQPYEVFVKDSNAWEEIHDYIINESRIGGIPNRKIECIYRMGSGVSVYQMSNEEATILRTHPKVEVVEKSTLYNPVTLERRRFSEKIDPYLDADRFRIDVENKKDGTPGTALTFTQWGLLRHSKSSNPYPTGTASVDEDIKYSLTGKNVDIVIMDNGVRWDHPEFLKQEYTSVPAGVSTASVSRVRDILIHGESEYGIDWTSYSLVPPGTGSLVGYTTANVLESSTFNGSWHGSHVAGTAAGNQFGWAFEANIWSIACVDRSDVGFSNPFDGFRYIRWWHINKPINPETGRKNPTILNCSWSTKQYILLARWLGGSLDYYDFYARFRGVTYRRYQIDADPSAAPAIHYLTREYKRVGGILFLGYTFPAYDWYQYLVDQLFSDPNCDDVICVCSAGDDPGGASLPPYDSGSPVKGCKVDTVGGDDYENKFFQFINDDPSQGVGSWTLVALGTKTRHYNKLPSPAITHEGLEDAAIVVSTLHNKVNVAIGESKSSSSNIGPGVDVLSAGSSVLGISSTGYQDPRNSSFYLNYNSGTSVATPQVSGVLACYAQSHPKITRVEARRWLYDEGSIVLPTDTGLFFDTYKDPVGVGSTNYWSNQFNLKGAEARILYNPTANNIKPNISGVNLSGENLKFKLGFGYS